MHAFLGVVFFNAVVATVLAVPIALVARRLRRPALLHALWLLVLLRLIAPPVFEFGLVPRWEKLLNLGADDSTGAGDPHPTQPEAPIRLQYSTAEWLFANTATRKALPESPPNVEKSERTPELSPAHLPSYRAENPLMGLPTLLFYLASTGSLLFLSLSLVRLIRFRRRLETVPMASPALQNRAARLAASFGIERAPRIRMVTAKIPPSLKPGWGRCEILFPEGLLERLQEGELDAILAHELAHIRRRDHWIRPLELFIVALYWWHPVAWWARRHLRRSEELACDAMVLSILGSRSRVYAQSLLKTIEFLTPYEPSIPFLATGATGTSHLKERITMILKTNSIRPMPSSTRPALFAILSLLLLVSPGWAEKKAEPQKPEQSHEAAEKQEKPTPEQEHQQELLALQVQRLQLQRRLGQLERQRQSLQLKIDEKRTQKQFEKMREKLEALKKDGRTTEVRRLQRQIASAELEAKLHKQKTEAELIYDEERAQIEYKLQDLQMEAQRAQLANDRERAQKLTEQSFALQQQLQQLELKSMQQELERKRVRFQHEKKELEEIEQ